MKVAVVGGGPAGLFFSTLLRRADRSCEVVVHERNQRDDPFGFGVVFSDATGHNLADADPETFRRMSERFARWDDIDVHYRGRKITSTGHGFSGLSRRALLDILADRALGEGVDVRFGDDVDPAVVQRDADLLIGADGANSALRERYAHLFVPTLDVRPNRFVWLGTTRPFPAFTFYFREDEHGLWRVHTYQYDGGQSTFIVETTEATWRAAGMDRASESDTVAFCERLFAEELEGHPLVANRSVWRQFATVRNARWAAMADVPVVLIGDAAHTAHFSIGSGTKLAMEDAIALAQALQNHRCAVSEARRLTPDAQSGRRAIGYDLGAALAEYEEGRRKTVESTQRAAQVSLQWFEETERYMEHHPLQFAFTLLTRSLRVTHDNLRVRDPAFVEAVDRWFAAEAAAQSGIDVPLDPPPPPLFTPWRVRELGLHNRVVVSPMCQYSADDGTPGDWHLVHLGSRAIGGAALVMAEMTDVSREARISPGCTGLYKPEHATAWKRIVDFVHGHSRAKMGVQLGHAGRKASTCLIWQGDCEPLPEGNWPIMSASAIPYLPHSQVPKAMDRADMDRVLADYVNATRLADQAGFDWLELHCAHGYLLASFVSPLTNVRGDEYGGPLGNRLRYPLEVFDAIRTVWPQHKPMSVRISAVDWKPDGVDSAEAVEIARAFRAHGCDAIDVSAGQTVADQEPVYGRLFQTPFSDRIRHEAGVPTMAVGNISSFTDVNTILAAGRADLCLMARMHLWNPYWTRHAAYEMGYGYEWPDPYASMTRFTPRFRSDDQ
ncbi:MAG TPA: bifunctional salicylyl-CoA 5-hydroxylase/oxidoreductase [Longimicrobiales bacterium]|nr:bifunctional salicylyl-CoA 5-hydroxylase/oxidoreductase [Longimicrobiales bacterium]